MEEQDNIKFDQVTSLNWGSAGVKEKRNTEKEYDSLYDELLDKCNPSGFKGTQKFYIANEIFSKLSNNGIGISDDELLKLRDKAIDGLDIHISTAKKFDYLSKVLNPDNFIKIKPYNCELVANAGRIYDSIIQNRYDIRELECIECDILTKYIIEEYDFISLTPNEYVKKYPKGRHADKAIQEIQEEYSRFNKCSAEEYIKEYPQGTYAIEAKNFIEDYKSYMNSYPNGRYKKEAEEAARKDSVESITLVVLLICLLILILIFVICQ